MNMGNSAIKKADENEPKEFSKTIESSKIEKKRKHGKLKAFFVFLFIIGLGIGYLIFSGAWNPFKSEEISREAVENYSNSDIVVSNIYNDVYQYMIDNQTDNFIDNYKPDGSEPYGFDVHDYGEKTENSKGIMKEMECTLYQDFESIYGLNNLYITYLKNEDYANEKYVQTKGEFHAKKDYKIDDNTKLSFGYVGENWDDLQYIIIKQGTVVYNGLIDTDEDENYYKVQNLLNKLSINFQLPNIEDVDYLR